MRIIVCFFLSVGSFKRKKKKLKTFMYLYYTHETKI